MGGGQHAARDSGLESNPGHCGGDTVRAAGAHTLQGELPVCLICHKHFKTCHCGLAYFYSVMKMVVECIPLKVAAN